MITSSVRSGTFRLLLTIVLVVTGCSDSDDDDAAPVDTAAPAATTAAPTATTKAAGADTTVAGQGQPAVTLPAGAAEVQIVDFAFTPATITVTPGQTLVFTNTDLDSHTVTSQTSDVLVSDVIPAGGQFTVTLDAPGTYDYVCNIHEFMSGSVEVAG